MGDISERRNPAQQSLAEPIPSCTPSVRQIWYGFLVMVASVYVRWGEWGANQFEFGPRHDEISRLMIKVWMLSEFRASKSDIPKSNLVLFNLRTLCSGFYALSIQIPVAKDYDLLASCIKNSWAGPLPKIIYEHISENLLQFGLKSPNLPRV